VKDDNGDISMLKYYPNDKKFTVMVDSKESSGFTEYEVSENFAATLNNYGIAGIMEERLSEFEKVMKTNGLSMNDSMELSYQIISKALK
jgi:hypothetical protein